jgi:hypothetical protein
MNILDQVARRTSRITPSTTEEFYAFCLARKLGEPLATEHYLGLLLQYSEEKLSAAFRRAVARPRKDADLARSFHVELAKRHGNGKNGSTVKLLAIKVERRSVAAVIFAGQHLDYTQVRNLSSAASQAVGSTFGFLSWLLTNFDIESAAIEKLSGDIEIRRSELSRSIVAILRGNGVPIWEVDKTQLFEAYGYPKLKSRVELRHVVRSIWPILSTGKGQNQILDAAALGLWVQSERLFIIN